MYSKAQQGTAMYSNAQQLAHLAARQVQRHHVAHSGLRGGAGWGAGRGAGRSTVFFHLVVAGTWDVYMVFLMGCTGR